jgi:hypothetical protein
VWRQAVSIKRFFSGRAFEPELIRHMAAAFDRACETLGLEPTDDPATRMVASKIIELAERGLRDEETLLEWTLRDFGINKK